MNWIGWVWSGKGGQVYPLSNPANCQHFMGSDVNTFCGVRSTHLPGPRQKKGGVFLTKFQEGGRGEGKEHRKRSKDRPNPGGTTVSREPPTHPRELARDQTNPPIRRNNHRAPARSRSGQSTKPPTIARPPDQHSGGRRNRAAPDMHEPYHPHPHHPTY